MKVLIVNTYDIEGGAARAAYRLHKALLHIGVSSEMLVQKKATNDFTVTGPVSRINKGFRSIRPVLDQYPAFRYKHKCSDLFSPAFLPFSSAVEYINSSDADVVHLHWVNDGYLRPEDIARIQKPIVWSLHDNWAFTGGCHIMRDCTNYRMHCGTCPTLGSESYRDLSYKVFKRKRRSFERSNITCIVGLSQWLANRARDSALLGHYDIVCLPNPIDTVTYDYTDRYLARKLLKLPINKKLIIFGAMNVARDLNKGFAKLVGALSRVKSSDVALGVFGSSEPQESPEFPFPAYYLGRLHDDVSLALLYSAADVVVVPSFQENLSNTIMESMSCGTPVVAFDVGGNNDLVHHLQTGYLATPYSEDELAHGIDWVLNQQTDTLRIAAREKVLECFEMTKVAGQYKALYETVIEG